MTPKVNIYKHTLKWAAISGAVLIIHRIALLVLGKDKVHQVYSQYLLLFFITVIIASIVAIYLYKKANNSHLTLKQALQIGTFITIIITILITAYDAVFLTIIEPNHYQSYYELNWEAEFEHHLSRNPEERTIETFKVLVKEQKINHFKKLLPLLLVYGIILSSITALITGLIMRTKQSKIKN